MTLTKNNLTEFRNRIPVAHLTKTFREIMEATVRMGIHYLWIDSLCIIQDLEENWNRESKMMGAIYEHAFCNLAAAKASNSDEGLFTDRSLFNIRPCLVDNSEAPYGLKTWLLQDDNYHGTRIAREGPLYARAWVTQEWLMSARILRFGRHQSYWQRLECSRCETHHRKI